MTDNDDFDVPEDLLPEDEPDTFDELGNNTKVFVHSLTIFHLRRRGDHPRPHIIEQTFHIHRALPKGLLKDVVLEYAERYLGKWHEPGASGLQWEYELDHIH